MVRKIVTPMLWAILGAIGVIVLAWPNEAVIYRDVIVADTVILEREVPGEVRFRDRIVYRFPNASVTATAPEAARSDVARFCAPTVALVTRTDTVQLPAIPRRELIRSIQHEPAMFPLQRAGLFVSSVTSNGDLVARDYKVRTGYGVRASDSILVRYSRFGIGRELLQGALWYGLFRAIEATVN